MHVRCTPISRSFFLFLIVTLCVSFSASAQNLAYPPIICKSNNLIYPNPSNPPLPAGSYNSVPFMPGLYQSGAIDLSITSPGTYTIIFKEYQPGVFTDTTIVTIVEPLQATIVNPVACSSSTATVQAMLSSTTSVSSYSWTWGGPPSVANAPLSIGPSFYGYPYNVTVTDTNGCTSTASGQVVINNTPNFLIIPPTQAICPSGANSSATLVAQQPAAASIKWSTGALTNSIVVSPANTTIYSATTSLNGCTATASSTITVSKLTLTFTASSYTVCAGKTVTLTAKSSPTVPYFSLEPGAFTIFSTQAVSLSTPQIYTISAKVGICIFTKTLNISVSPSFTVNTSFSYPFPLCSTYPNQLPILTPGFAPGGSFSISPATSGFNDTTGLIDMSNFVPGAYVVLYRTAAHGCTLSSTGGALLNVGQTDHVTLTPDVIGFRGAPVTLSVSGGTNYNWSPNEYISCTSCDAPQVFPPESMVYCVSSDLCIDGGCVKVTILCKNFGDLSVPNAFTPDGDGNNDKFCLQGWDECNKQFEIVIFDRWGEKVFQSYEATFCWDGVYNGKLLDAGVYTYAIRASYEIVPRVDKKGTITILR